MSRVSTLAQGSLAILAALLMLPTAAHATGTRYFHSSLCHGITASGGASTNAILNQFGQFEITATSGTTTAVCPLILDPTVSEIPTGSSVVVNAYENGGTSSFSAFALAVCRAPAAGGNPVCGGQTFVSGTPGSVSLTVSLPSVNVGDYLYVLMIIGPHTSTGGDNAVFGYKLVNP